MEEKVVMQELVNETLRMVQDKVKSKHMNILIDVDANLPTMLGDKRKIRQVLLNLLSNSLKFTPEEGTIKISAKLDNARNMTMTVSDTGIGIAEEDIPTALSVFGQVHRNQSHEGTGLGLPLCKMFAELHGGKLALGSTVGEGTTVRIIFPAARNLPGTATPGTCSKLGSLFITGGVPPPLRSPSLRGVVAIGLLHDYGNAL